MVEEKKEKNVKEKGEKTEEKGKIEFISVKKIQIVQKYSQKGAGRVNFGVSLGKGKKYQLQGGGSDFWTDV
jgi:hypothetical protein